MAFRPSLGRARRMRRGLLPSTVIVSPSPSPTVSISSSQSKNEGASGTTTVLTYTVTRSSGSGVLFVDWIFLAGSTSPDDFAGGSYPAGGKITFADDALTSSFSVTIAGDDVVEPNETFSVSIVPPSGYVAGGAVSAFGTIINDDVSAGLSITGSPSAATAGTGLPFAPAFANGTPPYVLSVASGTLPAGRAIVGNRVQGNYTTAASYAYVLRVTDSVGATADLPLNETVAVSGLPLNMQRLQALPTNPLIATMGASRFRQGSGIAPAGGAVAVQTMSFFHLARQDTPWFRYEFWNEANTYSNFGLSGTCYANDGHGFRQTNDRIDRALASDADVIFVNMAIADIDGDFSPSNYLAKVQNICNAIMSGRGGKYLGKPVVIDNVWERAPNGSGIWSVGSSQKLQITTTNQAIQTWADSVGIPVFDARSVMTYDNGNGDFQPLATHVRADGVHQSPVGGEALRAALLAKFKPFLKPVPAITSSVSGNLLTNGAFAGTAGTIGSGFQAGSVLANNWTASRSGGQSQAAVTLSQSSKVPSNADLGVTAAVPFQRITINPAPMTGGADDGTTFETVQLALSFPGAVAGKWYKVSGILEWSANPNLRAVRLSVADSSGKGAATGRGTDQGGGFNNTPMVMANAARSRFCESTLFLCGASGMMNLNVQVTYGASTTPLTVDLMEFAFREVADPHPLTYDESQPLGTTITNSGNFMFAGDGIIYPSIQLTSSKPGAWTITGGADAALWTVDGTGLMTRTTPMNYGVPDDADIDRVDDVQVTVTPFDLRDSAVVKALTIASTYAYTGFSDSMYRSTDVAEELSAGAGATLGWTKQGTGTQILLAQGGSATGSDAKKRGALRSTSGAGRIYYPTPQQPAGANGLWEQQTSFKVGLSGTSSSPMFVFAGKDADNWIGWRIGTGAVSLYKCEGGTASTVTSFPTFAPFGNVPVVTGRRLGDIMTIDQGGVTIGTFDMTTLPNYAAQGGYKSWTLGGIATNVTSSVGNIGSNYNTRTSLPLANKEGIPALTFTSTGTATSAPGAANQPGSDRLSNVPQGAAVSMQNVRLNGTVDTTNSFFADGSDIRWSAVAGTWTYDLVTVKDGAVPSGRITSCTTVIA